MPATKKPKKTGSSAMTRWWTLVGNAEGAQLFSDFEDPAGRHFSFLYTKGDVYLYPGGNEDLYSMPLDQIMKPEAEGLLQKMAGISSDSIAFQWLAGCLRGARGFGK